MTYQGGFNYVPVPPQAATVFLLKQLRFLRARSSEALLEQLGLFLPLMMHKILDLPGMVWRPLYEHVMEFTYRRCTFKASYSHDEHGLVIRHGKGEGRVFIAVVRSFDEARALDVQQVLDAWLTKAQEAA